MARAILKEVYSLYGLGVIAVVEIMQGKIKPGMELVVQDKRMRIRSIEQDHKQLISADSGTVGLMLATGDKDFLLRHKGQEVEILGMDNIYRAPRKAMPNHPTGFLSGLFRR